MVIPVTVSPGTPARCLGCTMAEPEQLFGAVPAAGEQL